MQRQFHCLIDIRQRNDMDEKEMLIIGHLAREGAADIQSTPAEYLSHQA
jgi:hypothetical protein